MKFGKYRLRIVGFKIIVKYSWIGFYWENNRTDNWFNLWICLLPMVPFQIAWVYGPQSGYEAVSDAL